MRMRNVYHYYPLGRQVMSVDDFLNPDQQPACAKIKYRSHSGECNNICFPTRGMESTSFIRNLPPDYADCKDQIWILQRWLMFFLRKRPIHGRLSVHFSATEVPRRSTSNQSLPSPRLVSSALIGTTIDFAPTWTTMVWLYNVRLVIFPHFSTFGRRNALFCYFTVYAVWTISGKIS